MLELLQMVRTHVSFGGMGVYPDSLSLEQALKLRSRSLRTSRLVVSTPARPRLPPSGVPSPSRRGLFTHCSRVCSMKLSLSKTVFGGNIYVQCECPKSVSVVVSAIAI